MGRPFWREDPSEEARAYQGLSFEERARMLKTACASAIRIARSRADSEDVLRFQQPPDESLMSIWSRLRSRKTSGRTT